MCAQQVGLPRLMRQMELAEGVSFVWWFVSRFDAYNVLPAAAVRILHSSTWHCLVQKYVGFGGWAGRRI